MIATGWSAAPARTWSIRSSPTLRRSKNAGRHVNPVPLATSAWTSCRPSATMPNRARTGRVEVADEQDALGIRSAVEGVAQVPEVEVPLARVEPRWDTGDGGDLRWQRMPVEDVKPRPIGHQDAGAEDRVRARIALHQGDRAEKPHAEHAIARPQDPVRVPLVDLVARLERIGDFRGQLLERDDLGAARLADVEDAVDSRPSALRIDLQVPAHDRQPRLGRQGFAAGEVVVRRPPLAADSAPARRR